MVVCLLLVFAAHFHFIVNISLSRNIFLNVISENNNKYALSHTFACKQEKCGLYVHVHMWCNNPGVQVLYPVFLYTCNIILRIQNHVAYIIIQG